MKKKHQQLENVYIHNVSLQGSLKVEEEKYRIATYSVSGYVYLLLQLFQCFGVMLCVQCVTFYLFFPKMKHTSLMLKTLVR